MKHPTSTVLIAAMILLGSTAFLAPVHAPMITATVFQPWVLMPWQPPVRHESIMATPELRERKLRNRWEKFEAEYGTDRDLAPSHLKHLAHAKYTADLTLFTAKNFLDELEDFLELRYSNGRIGRAATFDSPAAKVRPQTVVSLDDTRLKFDVAMASGKPYLGVRLVIPFGN